MIVKAKEKPYNMLIISGPSGCGKSTLTKVLQENINNIYFSISTTTREKRHGELDGREYFFITKDKFESDIKNGAFLEYEEIHGNLYGTSLAQISKAIHNDQFILFDIDVKGHNNIKKFYPNAKSIFITTKDIHTLENRLRKRGTDTEETIQKRLKHSLEEIKYIHLFDYLLINDSIEYSKNAIVHIAQSINFLNHNAKVQNLLKQYNRKGK